MPVVRQRKLDDVPRQDDSLAQERPGERRERETFAGAKGDPRGNAKEGSQEWNGRLAQNPEKKQKEYRADRGKDEE
jgi:hypothetical protein